MFGAFLALLNQTVMSPALPAIMADFGIDASTAQWIMSIYPLVSGIMVPVSAFLIDRFSTRVLFFAATAAFAAGTALCAAAPTFFLLICGRVLQAAASGVLLPLVSVVPMLVFPVEKRGTAMGVAGIVMSAGPAVGPVLGGAIIDAYGWRVTLGCIVPLALAALREAGLVRRLAFAIACMTVAANVGSMLTPIGNPQNIYLLSVSGMSAVELMGIMAPYSAAAFVLLAAAIGIAELRDRKRFKHIPSQMAGVNPKAPQESFALRDVLPWIALFAMCLLCVARIAPVWLVVASAIALALAFDMRALRHVDYALLFTFVAFFVFVGNVARIEVVREAVAALVDGRALLVGVVASQIISNVPAAILASGFTTDWPALLVGVNIGGLGTLIASMASLISYKQLAVAYPELKTYYFRLFTGLNCAVLAALLLLAAAIA